MLTHGHLDHILGLGGLASTFSRWEAIDHIEIFGGWNALRRVKFLIENVVLGNATPPLRIDYCTMRGEYTVMEDNSFTLSAFPVSHRGPGCFGFLFEEKPRHPFNAQKATKLGVPFGPQRRDLVNGQSITLDDGRIITPEEVLGDSIPGAKLAFMADVGKTEGLEQYVQNADAMVIEATYMEQDADMAAKFGHITAAQAASLAKRANVRQLFLTHISRRYRDRDLLEEARAIFPNTVVVNDFDRAQITRPEKATSANPR